MSAEAEGVRVTLVGGPLDGDTFDVSPQGSVGVPRGVFYLASRGDEAGWLMYEADFHTALDDWPQEKTAVQYHFSGYRSLDFSRALSNKVKKVCEVSFKTVRSKLEAVSQDLKKATEQTRIPFGPGFLEVNQQTYDDLRKWGEEDATE